MRRSLLVNFIIFNQEIHEINNFRDFLRKTRFFNFENFLGL